MRVLLADDHWFLYESMARLLDEAIPGSEVVWVNNFDDTLKVVAEDKAFDLILLDLNMPGVALGGRDRFSCLDQIKKASPDKPVAIFSSEEDETIVQTALSKGAAGYIPKSLGRNSLVAAMQLLVSGMLFAPRPVTQRAGNKLDGPNEVVPQRDNQKTASLSAREEEVLSLMMQGLSNKVIADRLGIKEVTVKEHVSAVLRKRGAKTRLEIIAAGVR